MKREFKSGMMKMETNKAFCILPWIHSYFYPDGKIALCCVSPTPLKDERTGEELNIQTRSLDEIFNSSAYESVRRAMLEGRQIENCAACYHKDGYSQNSHRNFYNEMWLKGKYRDLNLLEKIGECGDKNIVASPLSVDYRLSNLCNLKCQICNPQNSSQIEKDAEFSAWNPCSYLRLPHRFGDAEEWYDSAELQHEIIRFGENIRYIKLAGGEPTINRTLISWLEHLVSSGRAHDIELSISTNFTNTNRAFYELLESFETVKLHLSIDGYGELNDYLRYPSNWSAIRRNIEYVCERRDAGAPFILGITPVINIYNALQIVELFDWAEEMGLGIIANEVRGVPQIDCNLIPPKARKLACERISGYLLRSRANGSNSTIISLLHKLEESFDEELARKNIHDFYKFTHFIDSGRKLDFSTVCVEMSQMLQEYYGQTRTEVAMKLDEAILLLQQGRAHEAIAACQQVLQLEPENLDAVLLVGEAANRLGQYALAESFFRAAVSLQPDSIKAHNDLGMLLMSQGRPQQALDSFKKTLELCPDSPVAMFNVASAYYDMGNMDEAMHFYQKAIVLEHDSVAAHSRVGMIHFTRDHDLDGAWKSFIRAHQIEPDNIDVLNLLAKIRINQGRSDDAIPYVSKVLSQYPDHQMANMLMKHAETDMQDNAPAKEAFFNSGLIDQAEELARKDLAMDNSVENHNFLLKCYLASDRHTAADYFRESREWSKLHAHEELLPHPNEFKNDRDSERRLRVGIVGDYFDSVIGVHTLYPFFKAHDRSRIELYCYNFGIGEENIRPIVDQYRDIRKLPGADFFALIRKDAIDIMLDINGRIRSPNYFETLLRQPAPIQLNWYNLPCTVGVKAYNYAITDEYCVREGEENVFVENIFKMPTGMICAWDMGDPPVVARPRCEKNGYVTFGCFGDFFKVNERLLATWADLLGQVPDSRLYLKSNNLRLPSECERVRDFFKRRRIEPERLILEGMSHYMHMKKNYELVDIALDTFPYSSGSTTINALWQGVPVITLAGNDWRGRSTGAILAGAGLDRFIADDTAGYIAKAAALAADPDQLVELRATLGKHMAASPQWQVEVFTRNFESMLRMIWQDWLRESQ